MTAHALWPMGGDPRRDRTGLLAVGGSQVSWAGVDLELLTGRAIMRSFYLFIFRVEMLRQCQLDVSILRWVASIETRRLGVKGGSLGVANVYESDSLGHLSRSCILADVSPILVPMLLWLRDGYCIQCRSRIRSVILHTAQR